MWLVQGVVEVRISGTLDTKVIDLWEAIAIAWSYHARDVNILGEYSTHAIEYWSESMAGVRAKGSGQGCSLPMLCSFSSIAVCQAFVIWLLCFVHLSRICFGHATKQLPSEQPLGRRIDATNKA